MLVPNSGKLLTLEATEELVNSVLDTSIPGVINNPLRSDKNPSLGIFYSKSGDILYYDFATGETGNILMFLVKILKLKNYRGLYEYYLSFEKGVIKRKKTYINNRDTKSNTIIKVKLRQWKPYDLEYWNEFGISKKFLTFGNIYPISHIFIYKYGKIYTFSADKYAYVYAENKDDNRTFKVYQPFSEDYKWRNNNDNSVWELWNKLPATGEDLIITSSRKDALCIWENWGIPSTCLQSEVVIPKKHVIDELKIRFKNIYVFYDNDPREDNPGQVAALKLCKRHNLINICIPSTFKVKDPSDFRKRFGAKKFKQLKIDLWEKL